MGVFLLAFLFTVLLPLGEGVLLALLLREVHLRHPLPLGGRIPGTSPKPVKETQSEQTPPSEPPTPSEPAAASADQPPETGTKTAAGNTTGNTAGNTTGNTTPSAASVFDSSVPIADLQIQEVLNAMTAPDPAILPHDIEKRIEASSQPDTAQMQERNFGGDMDDDDLAALEAALPGSKPSAKIDFAADIEPESQPADNISPMAKELLGENFDFETLESNALNSQQEERPAADVAAESVPAELPAELSVESPAETLPITMPASMPASTPASTPASIPASASASIMSASIMPVQENDEGVVQVFCSPAADILPAWKNTEEEQTTVLPVFPPDWIQESHAAAAPPAENNGQFFFTEEMRPMFVRKKKTS